MDLLALLTQMRDDGRFRSLATTPRAQFGRRNNRLGARLLPERLVEHNEFREEDIRFRTVIASDNTRYSPPVLKNGDLIGSMLVELGESDIERELTGQGLDAMIAALRRNMDIPTMAQVINWVDTTLLQALLDFNERQRWQAIVDAFVDIRIGASVKRIDYLNPAGMRFNAGGNWSNDSYDPFTDINAGVDQLDAQGYATQMIITSSRVVGIMGGNAKVQQRAGRIVLAGGDLSVQSRVQADKAAINTQLTNEDWPTITTYDERYRSETSSPRFLRDDVVVLIGTSERTETIDFGDNEPLELENTLGYVGVGRPVGEADSGRVIRTWYYDDKPPRMKGQSWQTSFSVIGEPYAIAVIKNIQ